MRLTIGVLGSSGGDLSEANLAKAHRLGEAIAARDAVLITGGCPGLPYAAVRGAKAMGPSSIVDYVNTWSYTPVRRRRP